MIPSLYQKALITTSAKVFNFLQNHVENCESRNVEAGSHCNIELARQCQTFMEVREYMQSNLCTSVLQDLLDALSSYRMKEKQKMGFHAALPLLFNDKMTRFVIKYGKDCFLQWHRSSWDRISVQPVLQLLISYGENIVDLDILSVDLGLSNYALGLFVQCLEVMKNLRYLSFNLSKMTTTTANNYVSAVGQKCSNLLYLYIRSWKIDLEGVHRLIYRDYPQKYGRNKCCETVHYLSILNTGCLPNRLKQNIYDAVLKNFSNLRFLRDEDADILPHICQLRFGSFTNLTRLYTMPSRGQANMAVLSELCPNVTGLSFRVSSGEVISNLHLFRKLDTLDVHAYAVGFEKYLVNYGERLTTLYFHGHNLQKEVVDLPVIASACPNLEKIVLRNIRYATVNRKIKLPGDFLPKLKTVFLFYATITSNLFDAKILTWLQATNVKEIYVKGCLDFIMPTPILAYSKLKHFCIENIFSCVGFICLNYLLDNCPQLETLGSSNIATHERMEKVQRLVREHKNLQFLIEGETYPYMSGHPACFKVSERVLNNTSLYSYGNCSYLNSVAPSYLQ